MSNSEIQTGQAKFGVGDLVHHRLFNYRGVVVDIDPVFMLSDEWYRQAATSRPPKDQPWYRVLVHESTDETYVAERNLTHDLEMQPIEHPRLKTFFTVFDGGRYVSDERMN